MIIFDIIYLVLKDDINCWNGRLVMFVKGVNVILGVSVSVLRLIDLVFVMF